ncbi:hypothetical protein PHSC3_000922 [Chlamydiales bacterium STE3]|nr:hypothetical protein PHSC3_000922 [Chlamydiales bacterium STE3]
MNVVILAAGLGSRLDLESKCPKALTKLENGESLLGLQIKFLSRFLDKDRVLIVVGYHYESIMTNFPELTYCFNPDFASENTAGSLRRALRKVNGDLLWLNGDVIFHPDVIKAILNFGYTSMVVDEKSVTDEEVKYRTNESGEILEVSKEVLNPRGEAVGINFFKKEDLPLLKHYLEECQPTDYFEKAIELAINQGLKVKALPVPSDFCCEIDFSEDLARANQMIKSWPYSSIAR